MIHVVAVIETVEGKRDDYLKELHKGVPLTRAEKGCIEYSPAVDVDTGFTAPPRGNVVTIIEKWEDANALQDHLKSRHMLEYRERVKDLVKGITVSVLRNA